ncbi:MAG: beta-lactamase-like protein 2 [Candidatus Binatia bacterium]|nr:beta-lactamase-like protein 2 [Candidatus Binatia bacterium]
MTDRPGRIVQGNMIGLSMPDIDKWSDRVETVLGQNPGPFTGPGTNTYIVGTSRRPLILDTGQGMESYIPLLEKTLDGRTPAEIVLTHAHADHIGGCPQIREKFGPMPVKKRLWEGMDGKAGDDIVAIDDGEVIETEGATLEAIHTPGHAEDHLCYLLREERAIFTGDVVLGAGTTVIPEHGGDLLDYMQSLQHLLELEPAVLYPAHGPAIHDASGKIRQYIAHRELREDQIVELLKQGVSDVGEMVVQMYADVPKFLHPAAGTSVRSHLRKLEREQRASLDGESWTPR